VVYYSIVKTLIETTRHQCWRRKSNCSLYQ